MRSALLFLSITLISLHAFAQSPQKMSYQMVVRDSGDEILGNQLIGMQISILHGSPAGATSYVETQTPTTNVNGLASVEIGSGSVVSGNLSLIDWANGPYFIKTEIDPIGGITYTITGTSQLLSVPYALYAETTNPASFPFVKDIDGNIYTTVTIGNQVWIQQNLKTTRYQNGEVIANIEDGTAWGSLITGAYCAHNNIAANDAVYGKLYNWYAVVDVRNVCPTGWHVPSDSEWTELTDYLGGINEAGGKMKESGLLHWNSQDTGTNNSSGFSGLPGGDRTNIGNFFNLGNNGCWWSATAYNATNAWFRYINTNYSNVYRTTNFKQSGFSVRCVQD